MAKKLSNTPKGKLIWPRLTGTPDFKFNTAGVFSTKLMLTSVEGAPIVAAIVAAMAGALVEAKAAFVIAKAEYAKNKKAGQKPPKEPAMVDAPYFIDEETGNVTLSFKMVSSGKNRKTQETFEQKPVIFDAAGNVVTADIKIGGGTIGRVSYELIPFATALGAGASLRLKAVQVIELVEFGANAEYYGFDAEEGFSAPVATATTPAEEHGFDADVPAATAAGADSDDF